MNGNVRNPPSTPGRTPAARGLIRLNARIGTTWNDLERRAREIRETWASIWLFRTYEERSYYKAEHSSVTMALVHPSFPAKEANGVGPW